MSISNINSKFLFLLLIILTGGILIYQVDKTIERKEREKRKINIQKESELATKQFQKGVEKFSALVSGIRGFVSVQEDVPTKTELFDFLEIQFSSMATEDSIIISFVDTNHVFRYSITPYSLSPNDLEGKSVGSIRNPEEIKRLDSLMNNDDLRLFAPINLIEGYIGIPLNFRVVKNGVVQGYMASVINFNYIIDQVYNESSSQEFVYHFSTSEGTSFDRVACYDGSTVYNKLQDIESYRRFKLPESAYTYKTFSNFGYGFKIGVAYKTPYKRSFFLTFALVSWLFALGVFLTFLLIYLRFTD